MKKINWKVFLDDSELWITLCLLLALRELYLVTNHWAWLVVIAVWCGVLYIHLKYLSGLAVGDATKEIIDE